jgi:hypothetical protein
VAAKLRDLVGLARFVVVTDFCTRTGQTTDRNGPFWVIAIRPFGSIAIGEFGDRYRVIP